MEPSQTEPRLPGNRRPSAVVLIAFAFAGLSIVLFGANILRFGCGRAHGVETIDAGITGAIALLSAGVATVCGLVGLWSADRFWRRWSMVATFTGLAIVVGVFSTGVCGP